MLPATNPIIKGRELVELLGMGLSDCTPSQLLHLFLLQHRMSGAGAELLFLFWL